MSGLDPLRLADEIEASMISGQIDPFNDTTQTFVSKQEEKPFSSSSSLSSEKDVRRPTKRKKFCKDNCGICYEPISEQGVIDSCMHEFCFDCIQRWSEITNMCPICKGEFTIIRRRELDSQEGVQSNTKKPRLLEVSHKVQRYECSQEELEELARAPMQMANSLVLFPWLNLDDEEDSPDTSLTSKRGTSRERLRSVLSQAHRSNRRSRRGTSSSPTLSRKLWDTCPSMADLEFLRSMFGPYFEDEIIRMVLDEIGDLEKVVNTLLNMQVAPVLYTSSTNSLPVNFPSPTNTPPMPNAPVSPIDQTSREPNGSRDSVSADIERIVWNDFDLVRSEIQQERAKVKPKIPENTI